jgi:glycosyltransferase involved in cell wall biosynthesis
MATWNGAPTLPKVLEACCRLAPPADGWSLLIVDDGSTDGTREVIGDFAARLPLRLVSQARRGKHAALNLALQLSLAHGDAELIAFHDDDAVPAPDWLLRLTQCAPEQPAHAVFGGAVAAEWSEPPPAWLVGVALLAAGDVRAAIEAVGALLADPARRAAMALHARAEVEANYAQHLMAQRVRAFYAGLLP